MRGRDGDRDARLADLDAAEPVVDRDRAQAVPLGQLVAEPREQRLLCLNRNLYNPSMRGIPWSTIALGSLLLISIRLEGEQQV